MSAAASAQIEQPASQQQRMKILVVDDTPENLLSVAAALEGLNELVMMAQSGKEALRQLLENDFAAILLDVRMPEMDGFETAELIRARPRSRQTPIIFLSGYKDEEHLFRGYDLGAVDFLFKPIVPEVLRSKVSAFVQLARGSAKLREQADTLRKQADILRRAEQKFRSLLEAAPDAMVICRDDGAIILVNSQTEVVFGCSRDNLLARNIRSLVPNWDYRKPQDDDQDPSPLKLQPGDIGMEMHAVREDGSIFPVAISVRPLHTEEGVLVTTTIRDITVRKRYEEQIRQLNSNLEQRVLERTEALLQSNEELQQFAYIASHDLQEPLRTMSIFAQLLAKRCQGRLGGDADQFLHYVVESAERMERLIHDILDFSRVEARGTDHFLRTSCDEALNDAIRNLHVLIEDNRAVITLGPLPVVLADPVQITRLFQNLLVNSIRYRSDDLPRIHVSAEPRDGEWVFSVRDNGIGIEPQYAEKVFGIFKCLHSREKYPGNGMGLAICRKIVTRHGGRIWVDSELGKGATFCFTLPRSAAEPPLPVQS